MRLSSTSCTSVHYIIAPAPLFFSPYNLLLGAIQTFHWFPQIFSPSYKRLPADHLRIDAYFYLVIHLLELYKSHSWYDLCEGFLPERICSLQDSGQSKSLSFLHVIMIRTSGRTFFGRQPTSLFLPGKKKSHAV